MFKTDTLFREWRSRLNEWRSAGGFARFTAEVYTLSLKLMSGPKALPEGFLCGKNFEYYGNGNIFFRIGPGPEIP